MTISRGRLISKEEGVYHCISRCVRRAYLCGRDSVSGRNFNHRKKWVLGRLKHLAEIFSIEVLGYALMSTHSHTMLRIRPDIQSAWDSREVATRWLKLFPKKHLTEAEQSELIESLALDSTRIAKLRVRLGSISWFMKSLNEFIARMANREEECKGRFWEGRFKSQRLCSDAAILSCAVYVDLNPIRAKIAKTPESSEYTSAYERIKEYQRSPRKQSTLWIAPIEDTPTRRGFLNISLPEYLEILDSTGRQMRQDKRGAIPEELAPILERIGIKPDYWIETTRNFNRWFANFAGSSSALRKAATVAKKSWFKGVRVAERAFL